MNSLTSPLASSTKSDGKRKREDTKCDDENFTVDDTSPISAHISDHDARTVARSSNGLGEAAHGQDDEPTMKKSKLLPNINPNGLSQAGESTQNGVDEIPKPAEERLKKMHDAVRTLLECVGEDPDREGLVNTPTRYAKALLFFTRGYQSDLETIVNNALFHEGHHEMVIVKDIEIYTLCEHHLVPFTGKMHIGYIPNGTVIGLSKLPRIAEMFSRRLQIQERLTEQVAHAIMKIARPEGVAVVMESCHMCMVMRGVEKTGTTTITSCVLGCFEESERRNEFLNLLRANSS